MGPVDDRGPPASAGSSTRAPSRGRRRGRRGRDREDQRRGRVARRPASCAASVGRVGEVVPVGGLLGVIADADGRRRRHRRVRGGVPGLVRARGARRTRARRRDREVGAAPLRYLRQGEGDDAVVLLHGFGGDLNNWLFARRRWPRSTPSTRSTCPATAARRRTWAPATSTSLVDAVAAVPRRASSSSACTSSGTRSAAWSRRAALRDPRPRAVADAVAPRRARRGDQPRLPRRLHRGRVSRRELKPVARAAVRRRVAGHPPARRRRPQVQAHRRRRRRAALDRRHVFGEGRQRVLVADAWPSSACRCSSSGASRTGSSRRARAPRPGQRPRSRARGQRPLAAHGGGGRRQPPDGALPRGRVAPRGSAFVVGGEPGTDQVAAVSRRLRYEQRTVSGRRRALPRFRHPRDAILHAVPHARSARKATTKAAAAITPISRRTIGRARPSAGWLSSSSPTAWASSSPASSSTVCGGGQAQLLGDERDRHRQQRVEPVQAVGGLEAAGPRARPRRAPGRRAEPARRGTAPRTRATARRVHQRHAPSTPADEAHDGRDERDDLGDVRHLPLSIKTLQMVVEPSPSRDAPLVPASRRLPRASARPWAAPSPSSTRYSAPQRRPRSRSKTDPYECGLPSEVQRGLPLRDQLLPDRDAVHPVRHRGRSSSTRSPCSCGRSARSRSCETIVFIALLFVAFVYVWRRGALEWR